MFDIDPGIIKFIESVSIAIGVIGALWLFWHRNRIAKMTQASLQLKNWDAIRAFLDSDREIREKILSAIVGINDETIKILKSKYPTGSQAYLSEELSDFRAVGRHYEEIGAALKFGYLPVELLYEIIPFPDEFWTHTAALRDHIKYNWFGENKALESFWSNFEWMKNEWHSRR